ncbi:ferredoxin [Streptomyces sp. NPDC050560]|uniref:ferredoxin n=1 Tax=Streptomyces sp. NPDC050560 TaxID=3365630 RepID=UPI0037B0A314
MQIQVDVAKCQGYGNCVTADPDRFDLDDDGLVVLLRGEVGEDERAKAAESVRSCPAEAIRLVSDAG